MTNNEQYKEINSKLQAIMGAFMDQQKVLYSVLLALDKILEQGKSKIIKPNGLDVST
jgi:hypothetical protein